jgi:DNA replication protein DnaC
MNSNSAINSRVMQRVLSKKAHSRERLKLQAEQKLNEAFCIAEIKEAHDKYIAAAYDTRLDEQTRTARAETLHKAYINALLKNGFSSRDFETGQECPHCHDKGFVSGEICGCVKGEYIAELAEECGINNSFFSFKDNEASKSGKASTKPELQKIYRAFKEICAKYPQIKYNVILIAGATGTGKSCLASAMCRAFIENGNSALFMSAFAFNAKMLECHTAPVAQKRQLISDILSAELLVIDDLGTEPVYTNVTAEYLLTVLEERLRASKLTFITSNMDMSDILDHYGERIFSRLNDKRHCLVKRLPGDDLRLTQKV